MARYEDEFMGMPGEFHRSRGLDPNYQGHYGGMRMRGGEGQASYGAYRSRHRDDLGGSGGLWGSYEHERPRSRYDSGFRGSRRRLPQGGGVHDPRYDREYLQDFNSGTQAYRREATPRGYDAGMRPGDQHEGYRLDYTNRGLSSSGYAHPWLGARHGGPPRR